MTTTLTFSPPDWPTVLTAAAWGLLAIEAAMLPRRLARKRPRSAALGLGVAALLAGPVLVLFGLLLGVMTAGGTRRGGDAFRAGLRGSMVVSLALSVWWWGSTGAVVAVAATGVFWAIRAYQRTTRPISPRAKRRLLVIRSLVIVFIALWVLNPTWLHERQERLAPVLLMGVDRSASMDRRDAQRQDETFCSRREALQRILRREQGELQSLEAQADVEWFAFDETPTSPTPSNDGAPPAALWRGEPGSATAIGDAVQAVFDPLAAHGWDIAGVVLLTDGANNLSRRVTPEALAARMAARGVAVYTVGVGSPTVTAGMRSLTVQSCGAPTRVDAFNTMTIRPVVEALGLNGQTVEVTCTFGETPIGRQQRNITETKAEETFEFTHTPIRTGFHRLTVSARVANPAGPAPGGQPVADMLVQVTDREIRVLYIEGTFRYETKYITQALGSSRRITLHRWILHQPLRRGRGASPGEDIANWLGYHAILLGDVAADRFTPRQRAILKTLVSQYGKGLAMIGGDESFGRGGWGRTELADVLGVDLKQSTEQIRRPIQPQPTAEGAESELMHIGQADETPEQSWAKLDALPGANLLTGVKPAATVLANLLTGEPMIVAQPYGKGRSLAIAFDTTWRWVLSPNTENTAAMQKRFWRQVVL
ncbi:MAG: VWA domain-containing protein, partial [Phycisphaerae bacterium]|nr:VWA domain-containing protein [Phycisphaerae bacterium]